MARAETMWNQMPEASSGFPTYIQGPKALGHHPLLSQVAGMKLDMKWNSWDRNHWPLAGGHGTHTGRWRMSLLSHGVGPNIHVLPFFHSLLLWPCLSLVVNQHVKKAIYLFSPAMPSLWLLLCPLTVLHQWCWNQFSEKSELCSWTLKFF